MQIFQLFNRSLLAVACISLFVVGCAGQNQNTLPTATTAQPKTQVPEDYTYLIGPGDEVNIFVWRNPEVSNAVTVRPDGKITSPLVEELAASGKTPAELARDIEEVLSTYIKEPIVTVIVQQFAGPYSQQIRIIGEAHQPQSIPYRQKMSLMDVMIAVGGLTEFAAGNKATIARVVDGELREYTVRISSLLRDGDISANVDMLPGDILIIPESFF